MWHRILSVLKVDFSCALKLAMPLVVLSALWEAGRTYITVKGGSLIHAFPQVAWVAPFGGKLAKKCCAWPPARKNTFPIPRPTRGGRNQTQGPLP